jgi:acetyl esterase
MPLDSQCRALIDAAAAAGATPFDAGDHLAVRAAYATTTTMYRHATGDLKSVLDTSFPGPAGEVAVRIYRAHSKAVGTQPCLIFFHGGGWAVGDLDTHDHMCRHLAHGSDAIVIAVDYRLAPEHKFPAPLEDCLAAVHWVIDNAAELDVDPTRVALGGDSAGGNLTAAVTIALRDSGGPKLALQLLLYPAVDFTADNESITENANGYLLTRAALEMFTDFYLPNRAARSDPRASPLLSNSHADLPRAFIQTAEFDPLRDEGRAYAEALMAAGCPVEYKCYPGVVHGFARMGAKVDAGLTALNDACGVLRETFGLVP